ncbi:TetR family transcriptional regulator [Kineococcus sp. NPDC059986]|jgi:AcrR family transcriptional regulator|uniref:TetR/AcrR family transcriptional regulator n=1 Tax=Kineococcus sp. NPDC059986 TaxID=3155538 RepID=UPI00344CC79A
MTTTAGEARPAGPGRQRLHEAALRLFSEHGVSGTSLQMIADEVGVTKAAVYYHYRTKDDLVVGVVAPFIDRLFDVLEVARARRGRRAQVEVLLTGLVDLIVDVRHLYVVAAFDPVIAHLHEHYPRMREIGDRMRELLAGPDADAERRVAVVFFLSGLVGPLGDESCRDIPDEDLRRMLLETGRRSLLPRRASRA